MVWGSAVLSPLRKRPCCALGKPADKLSPTTLLTLPNESNPQFKLPGGPLRATLRQVEGGLCAPLSPNPSRLTSALYLSPSPTLRQNQFSRNQVTGGGPSGLLKEGEGGWRGRVERGKRSHALGPSVQRAETSHFPLHLYTLPLGSKPGFI